MEASLYRHDQLNHWLLVTKSISNSSLLFRGKEGSGESFNGLMSSLGLLATSPPSLGAFQVTSVR